MLTVSGTAILFGLFAYAGFIAAIAVGFSSVDNPTQWWHWIILALGMCLNSPALAIASLLNWAGLPVTGPWFVLLEVLVGLALGLLLWHSIIAPRFVAIREGDRAA